MSLVGKAELPFRVTNVRDNFSKLKILIYGPSGCGKTVLAGSICEVDAMNPALGIDIEGGMASLAAFGYENLTLTETKTYSTGEDNFVKAKNHIINHPTDFASCIIDSVTELQDLVLQEKMRKMKKEEPDLNIWGLTAATLGTAIRQIRDLPINVIVTALEKEITNKDTGEVRYAPSLSGKLAQALPGFFDIVGRMTTFRDSEDKIRRGIEFAGDDRILAKDRTGALGETMVDPTMTKIYSLIKEKHNLER